MNIHIEIKKKLLYFVENNIIPHIIFHGPSGCGKRHIVQFLINKIYPTQEETNNYVMYINCAHGKGIRFIRDELKFFAKMNIHNRKGSVFKSIVLFNADKLTTDAQSALRRCIEQFSHTTRFFIVIDQQNKLLRPILSRFCSIYVPLPKLRNQIVDLHTDRKRDIEAKGRDLNRKRTRWLRNKIGVAVHYKTPKKCYQLAEQLYDRAYTGIDMMNIFENSSLYPKKEKYGLLIRFDRARREFRCEKLFIFYILVLGFMRRKDSLENI